MGDSVPLKVFISHSTKSNLARQALDAVAAKLTENGLDVLLDRARLAPGDGWRTKLFAWLDLCDAAVILFSEEALASDWVRFEAGILCWRRARTGRPLVVPVFLGQVSPDAPRRHGLEPVLPEEIQAVPIPAEADEAALKVATERICGPILCLARQAAATEVDESLRLWLEDLRSELPNGDSRPEALRRVIATWLPPGEAPPVGETEFVAHRLLLDDLRRNQVAIELLCPRVPNPRRLVELVLPSAIPAEFAARLLQGVRRKTASRLVALPVESADLALLYVERAACRQPGFDLVEALDSTEAQGILAADGDEYRLWPYVRAFYQQVLAIDEPPESLQDCRAEIADELRSQSRTLLLTVRRRDHEPQFLQALADLFPGAALILIDRVPVTPEVFPAETVLVGESVTATGDPAQGRHQCLSFHRRGPGSG